MRFFGPRGDLLAAEAPEITVYTASGDVLFRTELAGFLDIAPVGDEPWALSVGRLTRLSARDGSRQVGDPGVRAIDAQVILDGRLFVLVQQRATPVAAAGATSAPDVGELRLTVAQVSDGAQNTQLRLPPTPLGMQVVIAARRGLALARSGDRLSLIDLRFGRWSARSPPRSPRPGTSAGSPSPTRPGRRLPTRSAGCCGSPAGCRHPHGVSRDRKAGGDRHTRVVLARQRSYVTTSAVRSTGSFDSLRQLFPCRSVANAVGKLCI